MPRLAIPSVGTKLTLSAPWIFVCQSEQRNVTLLKAVDAPKQVRHTTWQSIPYESTEVTIPVGTSLIVRRVYVRQGGGSFDSLTFSIVDSSDGRLKGTRFWAKLEDVNRMDAKFEPDILPRG